MNGLEKDVLRRYLLSDAARLRSGRSSPVDLEILAGDLGVKITIETKSKPHGAEATLVPGDACIEIVVFRSLDGGNGARWRERFTLAHEIGHYCALRRFNLRPRSRSEYWKLEQACDEFAGYLLVGEDDVETVVMNWSSPADVMRAIGRLREACDVSTPVAARRLSETIRGMSFCDVRTEPVPRPNRLGTVKWCWEDPTSPWLGYGAGRYVGEDSPIAPLVRGLAQAEIGAVAEAFVGGTAVRGERRNEGMWFAALHSVRNVPWGPGRQPKGLSSPPAQAL